MPISEAPMEKFRAPSPLIIALDGPAASGKGTLSRLISDQYGLAYLDTGTLYRGVAWLMLQDKRDPADHAYAAQVAKNYDLKKSPMPISAVVQLGLRQVLLRQIKMFVPHYWTFNAGLRCLPPAEPRAPFSMVATSVRWFVQTLR